ncbi:MAG: hypothetical protein Q4A66_07350 [Eubacteriales bacterium]|nr:hypothetical protein [Eubacteriales bacterium]
MDHNKEFLSEIARSARMGKEAAVVLLEKVQDEGLRREIGQRKAEYSELEHRADDLLADSGTQPEPLPAMSKAGLWMGMQMETLADKSDSHIAEIMIQGSNMGIIEMTKNKKRFAQAAQETMALADSFLAMEEGGVQRMKEFL